MENRNETKKAKLTPILIGILLIIGYQIIFPLFFAGIFAPLLKSENFWISNIINIVYYLLVALALILGYRKSLKEEWKTFWNHRKQNIKVSITYWLKGFLLMILSNLIVMSVTGNIAGNEETNREILGAMPLFSIVTMCFIAPFIEEMLFRKSFRKGFDNKYLYAIFTSLIFAGLHVINSFDVLTLENILANWQQLLFFIPYGSLAFFFALSYYETDTIFTSTLAHCLHNTLTVGIILISL